VDKAPDAFRTISEVADDLDIPQHVLRFWESKFPQIKPMKRAGGRRYYRPDDVDLLRGIRHLLYGEGYTIRGVQRILRDQGPKFVQSVWQPGATQPIEPPDEDDAPEAAEARPTDEPSSRSLFGLLKQPAPPAAPSAPQASAPPPGLAPEDRQRLQSVLHELGECRKLLEEALKGEAT
jgi:DNA-binding transcriptional MerR regulator